MSFSCSNSDDAFLDKKLESLSKFISMLDDGFELLELVRNSQGRVVDFVFVEVNPAYERQTGLKAANIIGKRKKEVAPAAEQRWFDYAIKAINTNKTLRYQYYNPIVDTFYETQFIPLPPDRVAVLIKDVTERKKTKETLKISEQKYRELYESFDEAFIATDWEFNVIHWNKAAERVTTVPAKVALGKKIYDVLPEMLTIDVTPYFESLKQKKSARFMMNTFSRETKRPSVFEISTYPSDLGIIVIVEDKTDEEERKRLSAIGATAGMVGHDIRNPLQAVLSDTYLLRDELTGLPECKNKDGIAESIDSIEKNVAYINKIVQDLQDYSRTIIPEIAETNLSAIVSNIFNILELPDTIKLSLNVKAVERVRTDHMILQRALTNLVTNAIQAMPNGGSLKINGQIKDNKIVITVIDTGIGIPDEVKSKLFTPMMTTKAKGQGFGLAVSKRLIEALNGTISFESQVGRGTKFIIELPMS